MLCYGRVWECSNTYNDSSHAEKYLMISCLEKIPRRYSLNILAFFFHNNSLPIRKCCSLVFCLEKILERYY